MTCIAGLEAVSYAPTPFLCRPVLKGRSLDARSAYRPMAARHSAAAGLSLNGARQVWHSECATTICGCSAPRTGRIYPPTEEFTLTPHAADQPLLETERARLRARLPPDT